MRLNPSAGSNWPRPKCRPPPPDGQAPCGDGQAPCERARPLRSDREHVADDEHPDHQFRVNRWPTSARIIARQLSTDPRQVENRSYLANQMIVRNGLFKTESIKQLPLVLIEPPHHRPSPQRIASQQPNHRSRKPSMTFATKSALMRHAVVKR